MAPLFVWECTIPANDGDLSLGLFESKTKAKGPKGAQKDADEYCQRQDIPTQKLKWEDGNGYARAYHPNNAEYYWITKRKVIH